MIILLCMSKWKPRSEQMLPYGNWKIWLLLAGRGFGKTRAGAEAILNLIKTNRAKNIGILGITVFEARNIMVEGQSGILPNSDLKYKFNRTNRRITFENGAICQYFGADRYDKLRGFQFDWIWIDEFAKFSNGEEALKQVFMCLRLGESKLIITTTPKNKQVILDLMTRNDIHITRGTSLENKNLSDNFGKNIESYKNTKFGKQEILGEIIDHELWNIEDIKYKKPPELNNNFYYTIGIDPAVEKGRTGIVLAFTDCENIYILNDFSTNKPPKEWLSVLYGLHLTYENISISVEVNQGGKLLEELMHMYNIRCKIYQYRAFNSKYERNVASHLLYQQNRVFHVNILKELEDEMLYGPKDRVDALYWAIYNLKKYLIFE